MSGRRKKPYLLPPNRDLLRNCFLMPNEIFRLNLSAGAITVYTYLRYIENRSTYECNAKYETIGSAVGMSRNTVMKYVRELKENGLIATKRMASTTANGSVQLGSLRYTILPIRNAADLYNERLLTKADAILERSRAQKKLAKMKSKKGLSPHNRSGRLTVSSDAYEKNVSAFLRCHSAKASIEKSEDAQVGQPLKEEHPVSACKPLCATAAARVVSQPASTAASRVRPRLSGSKIRRIKAGGQNRPPANHTAPATRVGATLFSVLKAGGQRWSVFGPWCCAGWFEQRKNGEKACRCHVLRVAVEGGFRPY